MFPLRKFPTRGSERAITTVDVIDFVDRNDPDGYAERLQIEDERFCEVECGGAVDRVLPRWTGKSYSCM